MNTYRTAIEAAKDKGLLEQFLSAFDGARSRCGRMNAGCGYCREAGGISRLGATARVGISLSMRLHR